MTAHRHLIEHDHGESVEFDHLAILNPSWANEGLAVLARLLPSTSVVVDLSNVEPALIDFTGHAECPVKIDGSSGRTGTWASVEHAERVALSILAAVYKIRAEQEGSAT